MSANTLLISDVMIKERTSIHTNIDPKNIYPDIKWAQDVFILPLLGTALYEKLQAIISNGTITSDSTLSNYKLLIDKYVTDALIYYVLSELPMTLGYQFYNKGVVRKNGQDTDNPDMSELVTVGLHYKQRAEHYGNRMMLYVKNNASAMYPEYLAPGNSIDTVVPEQRAFTMPIFIGDNSRRDNPYCNPGGFNGQPYKD